MRMCFTTFPFFLTLSAFKKTAIKKATSALLLNYKAMRVRKHPQSLRES